MYSNTSSKYKKKNTCVSTVGRGVFHYYKKLTKALTKDTVLRYRTPWRTKGPFYDNLKEREPKKKENCHTGHAHWFKTYISVSLRSH